MLKNSPYPIIVIDDASDKPDTEYLQDKRIRVIYNKKKNGLTHLWNQIIIEAKTEYVIIAGDKLRPKQKDFELVEKKLNEGFALVATYMMGFFGFSKDLTTKIGMMDEGYKFSGYEDTDLMNKLFINNLAFYFSTETKYVQIGSGWKTNSYNKKYFKSKWVEDWKNKRIIQLKQDQNKEDIDYYKGTFKNKTYLTFDKSEFLANNIKKYYGGKSGYIQLQVSNNTNLKNKISRIINNIIVSAFREKPQNLDIIYSDVIANIILGSNFKSYLEIGVDTGFTLRKVLDKNQQLELVTGVDLKNKDCIKRISLFKESRLKLIFNTNSNEFFKKNKQKFDGIFIDADHSYKQSRTDFFNALTFLNSNGIIFLHDTYPPNKEATNPNKCGDTYKLYLELSKKANKLNIDIVNLPFINGLSIIRKLGKYKIPTIEK